jgi:SdrD B-like protein/Calx-beta domain-containing protein
MIWNSQHSTKRRPLHPLARRTLTLEPLERRLLLSADMRVRFEFTDPIDATNTPLNTITQGTDFQLAVYVQDIRGSAATGVLQAYFDVQYNDDLISTAGPVSHEGSEYGKNTFGDISTAGVIDDVGGLDTDRIAPQVPGAEFFLFNVPFHADAAGTLDYTLSASGFAPRGILFFRSTSVVPLGNIEFVNTSIEIVSAGIQVNPTSGLTTTEAGGTANFNVALTKAPTSNVTINLSSSDTTEGVVSPSSLTFTPQNWSTSKTATVTGQDDAVDDGNVAYTIVTAAAVSSDADYSGLNADDVSLTNSDNDTAGINILPASGLATTEAGGKATFQIELTSQPTADVTVGLTSSDTTEGDVSSANVVFTPSNWNAPRTITVTGQNDDVDDDNVGYTIVTAATSGDFKYDGMDVADVSIVNRDDDAAGIDVSPSSGRITTEGGGTDTFQIVLTSQPTADVTVGLTSSDTSEGTVSSPSVVFTSENWDLPKAITITGENDDVDDDDISYTIVTEATSSDLKYGGLGVADISVVNRDNDTAGLDISATSGLETTEGGGTDTFQITLTSQPTANVTIELTSSDTSEGTVSSTNVVFTSANWDTAKTVTVTGENDDVDDDDVHYTIVTSAAASSDSKYAGMSVDDVSVLNRDDDTAGIDISPTSGLETTEAGGSDTFQIVLTSQPTADVKVGLTSSNTNEGLVSLPSVTFTALNWKTPQTVTVRGVEDAVDDGDVGYTIFTAPAAGSDSKYGGIDAANIAVLNRDDDTAGVEISRTSGLETTEMGGVDTFGIVLGSQPTADVTVGLSSTNVSEGTVSTSKIVFTSSDWNAPQTVTVTGEDDAIDDDDVSYTIVTMAVVSNDSKYGGMDVEDVSVINRDDDTAGIEISPTSGLETTESGGTDTFEIVLTSEPKAEVVIGLTSSDTNEGKVAAASVVFNASNWATSQTVTVTGQDDFVDDGDRTFTILTAAASSDPKYHDLVVGDVEAVNMDDDTAGVLAIPFSGLETTEAGHSDTFTIELTSQPTANVTIGLMSSNESEGTIAPTSVTFTPTDWNLPQAVTVTGQDDVVQDGDVTYSVVLESATSSDSIYNGLDPADVTVVNLDDDIPGFFVLPTKGLVTTEGGGKATFEVSLRMQPTFDVTINLSGSNTSEGIASDGSLVFTSENWATPQEVTVTGQDDAVDDDDIAYTIVLDAAVSDDSDYNGLDPDDVMLTNLDDDTAGVTVLPTSGLETTEAGGTDTFQIVLTSEPTAGVTIGLATSNSSEGAVLPTSIEFSSANWNIPQTITVTGQDDAVDDGDVSYTIVTAAAGSSDSKYFGMDVDDVLVVNRDDDTAGVDVSPTSGLETTEAGGADTFQIILTSKPTADVTIALASSDTSEGTVSSESVEFTPVNWNTPQTLTITGQNDAVDDGDANYTIVTAAATSNDLKYEGMGVDDVSVVNRDDDTAGIEVSPTSGLETTETGGIDTFEIVLTSQPTADVTVGLTTSDTGEGSVSAESLVFTSSNWSTPQTVTVTGQDDAVDDDEVSYTIVMAAASSSDSKYAGMSVDDVSVVNRDDDTAGIDVSRTSGLETTEAGKTDVFEIVLTSQPTADVTIGLTSSDTSEGVVSATNVVFTSFNWNRPQTLTITGQDDAIDDDDVSYTIVAGAAEGTDSKYAGIDVADVSVVNRDDDTAGIVVSPTSGLETTEAGGTDVFQVVLASEPTASVTVALMPSDASEGTVSLASAVFTAANWSTPQSVTISGLDDFVDDGDVAYTVVTADAVSSDSKYDGMDVEDVAVSNRNDDTAEVIVSPTSGLETWETGGTDTFEIRLGSQPLADVTVGLASSDTGEGTVSAATLTFDSTNWSTPQTITLTGQDDGSVDGDVGYTIATTSTSGDSKYDGMNVSDVTVTNRDDDSAVLTLSSVTGPTDEGSSGTVELVFEVSLFGSVEGGFHIAYTTDDDTATTAGGDYVDNDGTLAFDGTDGETKTISVKVNGDSQVELDERFLVSLGGLSQISASAAERISVEGSPATGEIRNDDTTTLTIGDVSRVEGTGGTASDFVFSVMLSNAVQGGLSVDYATTDGSATAGSGDYGVESGTLEFSGSAGETKTVTVQVAHDAIVERDEVFSLALLELADLLAPALADDIQIFGRPATGTIENDDSATVSFADSSSLVIEAMGSHAVDVVLDVTSGGTLSESVTVNVNDLLTGSAQTPQDYTLGTLSVTFGAGSGDKSRRQVDLGIVVDEILEEEETVRLGLSVDGDGIGGAVALATPSEHDVTITDDPMTAVVSGIVWVDGNNNGVPDANEATIPGVVVSLEGEDLLGRSVEGTTITDNEGRYQFVNLPGGTYSVVESQPEAFHDGQESLGTVGDTVTGDIGDDRFTGIVVPPAQVATDYGFGEWGLRASYVSNRLFLTSTVGDAVLRERVALGEEKSGDMGLAQAIRYGESVTVQRIGAEVTVTGSDSRDMIEFTPAGSKSASDGSRHHIDINGLVFLVDKAEADEFTIEGNDGYDDLVVHDSSGDDLLEASGNGLRLVNDEFTLEALAFEAVLALSESGGDDQAQEEVIDYLLRLEGAWDER